LIEELDQRIDVRHADRERTGSDLGNGIQRTFTSGNFNREISIGEIAIVADGPSNFQSSAKGILVSAVAAADARSAAATASDLNSIVGPSVAKKEQENCAEERTLCIH